MTERCTQTVTSTQTCTDCVAQEFIPRIPPHVTIVPLIGWDAGANSQQAKRYSGGVSGRWKSPLNTSGTIVGLAPPTRASVLDPVSITHGIYVYTVSGTTFAQAMMSGVPQGAPTQLFSAVTLEVRRAYGVVQFYVGGDLVYQVSEPSDDTVMLACSMFASGDIIQ